MIKTMTCVFVLTICATASAQDETAVIAARSIAFWQQKQQIQEKQREALGGLPEEQRLYQQIVDWTRQAPLDAEALKQLDQRIAKKQAQINVARKNGRTGAWVESLNENLTRLRIERQVCASRNPMQRVQLRNKAQAEVDRLQVQIDKRGRTYAGQLRSLDKEARAFSPALEYAFESYFKTTAGAGQNAVRQHFTANASDAFMSVQWNDATGNQVAWAHIRLRPESEVPAHARKNLLGGKYPIQTAGDHSLWVWAGNALIAFVPTDEQLKNEAALKKAVFDYIDMTGLASIEAPADLFAEQPEADDPTAITNAEPAPVDIEK